MTKILPIPSTAGLVPDIVLLIRRDGVLLEHIAGQDEFQLNPGTESVGERLESLWPEPVATLIKQLVRRAITDRSTVEGDFHHGRLCHARVTAQGPDRAICVIRAAVVERGSDTALATGEYLAPQFDRRGFLRRFKASMSSAVLREKPTAIAIIHVDGVAEIARIIGSSLSEQVIGVAVQRLSQAPADPVLNEPPWYMGQLSEGILALVLETADRDAIDACVARACQTLCTPIALGDATFHLTAYAGAAILGQDATSPKMLLDHARAAANEARRSGSSTVCFFTDTVRLRSLARLDITRELREAIAQRAIRLQYSGRYDLATGQLVAHVGYLRWTHPLRGEVRPAEFVSVAEATGLAPSLSRSLLECLREDFATLAVKAESNIRISFGALRHHIFHEEFVADISRFIAEGAIPSERLELRISERTFVALEPTLFHPLKDLGVHLVVDEVGRGMTSLDRLARAPLWGLQLDRSWASIVQDDPVALKVCGAGMSVATALGLTPIATGVDDQGQRQSLLALGCKQGMGDFYQRPLVLQARARG